MSMMSLVLLGVCPAILLAISLWMMFQHRYHVAMLLIGMAVVTAAVGGLNGYREMDAQAKQATESSFDTTQREALAHRYQQAVEILQTQEFSHPDAQKLSDAVKFLTVFED